MGLDCCATKLEALVIFCFEQMENMVESAKIKVISLYEGNGIPTERRVRRRKKMMGGNADDVSLSLQEEVIREQLQIIDTLHGEIKRRTNDMIDVTPSSDF